MDWLSPVASLSVGELGAAPSSESPQPISKEATDKNKVDLKSDDMPDIPMSKESRTRLTRALSPRTVVTLS
jgi:hypothetical protein